MNEIYSRKLARKKIKESRIYLSPNVVIHHIDENPFNNKAENLKLMTRRDHSRLHIKIAWRKYHEDLEKESFAIIRELNLEIFKFNNRLWNQ